MDKLDAAEMLAAAEQTTGLTDWGEDEFREPFELLVWSINEEASLNEIGLVRARNRLQQRLCQRLKLFEDRKRRPEIAAQKIERPIFVAGMPRAGTTYTHALLGADPANVAPLGWQLTVPSPPPNDPAIDHEPAIREAQAIDDEQGWSSPHIRAMHDFNPLHPEECARAIEFSFHAHWFLGYWNMPSYFVALPTRDGTPAYEIHRKVLQALQVGVGGRRWVLKAPDHTTQLDSLFKIYPDAMLVQNHRDPAKVMASLMSIISGLRNLYTEPTYVTREFALGFMQAFADGLQGLIRIRQNPEIDRRCIDVHYLDLERDPLAVMRRIYSRTSMTYDDASEKAISRWIATNRKGKHGKHQYSLADVNVTKEETRSIFNNYIEYYNIELEVA